MQQPSFDDTQPRRLPIQPPPNMIRMDEEESSSGPGCLVWGMVGIFMLLLALATVFMATFAGWNDGLRVANANAESTRNAEITTQCNFIPSDLANGNASLADKRLQSLLLMTPAVPCIATYAPQITAVYVMNMATATPTITPTAVITVTAQVADATPIATSASGFDLNKLLAEAQGFLAAGENKQAIETLDAIVAVDATFQKGMVDQMLFQALTNEANKLFLNGTNLAEAIVLTDRAEQYGDIDTLNYERYIAEIYLSAEAYKDVDYGKAITGYANIYYDQGLTTYRDVSGKLYDQYVKYADAFSLGGDPCNAVDQYNNALNLIASQDVVTKRDTAVVACSTGVVATIDPLLVTPDATGGTSGSGVAPIGQRP